MSANKTIDIEEEEDDCPLNAACSSNSMESSTSNNESNEDIPNVQQCKILTEQFAEITGTDTALAQFFLQDRQWNLERSVNAYFESRKGGVNVLNDGDQPELVLTFDSKMVSALENAEVTTEAPKHFKLLSWNIDGLDTINLKKRTKAVMKVIESEKADIVFLQEVVPTVYNYMEERFPQYMFIAAGNADYFVVMMLLRTTVYFDGHKLIEYQNSLMGRNLLAVEAHIGSCKLRLLTTHLESTKDFSAMRKEQLRLAFGELASAPSHVNAVLGGDLNLRDNEVEEVGLPNGVVDVWEATGKRPEAKFTWDLKRNTNLIMNSKFQPRCRFDRIYFKKGRSSNSSSSSTVPRYFELVGLKKVAGTQRFPSDHWGLLTHFEIVDST